jgi:hypothetical protein
MTATSLLLKILCLPCVGLLGFIVLPVHAAGPRTMISEPQKQCFSRFDMPAGHEEKQHVYALACGAALRKMDISQWVNRCEEGWNVDRMHPSLATQERGKHHLLKLLMYHDSGMISGSFQFHNMSRGRFIIEVVCRSGAYNSSSIFFAYDESRLPATIHPIRFPQPNGSFATEIWARAVDIRRGEIVEFRKRRGMGDAGYYARYAIDRKTLRPTLLEAIAKQETDGYYPFHLDQIESKPQTIENGRITGWKRIYPYR